MRTKFVGVLLFLSSVVVKSLPTTVLVNKNEQHCFFQHTDGETEILVRVFVFYGGSFDIGLSVSCFWAWKAFRTHLSCLIYHSGDF